MEKGTKALADSPWVVVMPKAVWRSVLKPWVGKRGLLTWLYEALPSRRKVP